MTEFYPIASGLAETESLSVTNTELKKRIYAEASAVSETETLVPDIGLIWFLETNAAETESSCKATPFVRHFPNTQCLTELESNLKSLALWPEPPTPTATVSCNGKDLHKQSLKQGDSHQITLSLNFTGTSTIAVGLTELTFKITNKSNQATISKKTRFGIPGGLIVDFVQDLEDGKVLLVADLQLRPNETLFTEKELELDFSLKSGNAIINQSVEIAKGTVIFYN